MADLIAGVVAFLLTQAPITAIIAGGTAVQPLPAPPNKVDEAGNPTYPCIVYQVASDNDEMTLTGSSGVGHSRVLFSCHAWYGPGSYGVAHSLGLAVKAALNGYQGTLPGGPQVFFADVVNAPDLFQADALLSTTNVSVMFSYQS